MKFSGDISFARCFGHGVLFISIDTDSFEFRQHRVYPLNWWSCGSCFKLSDSVKIYDVFSDAFHYLRQKATIAVTFDEKYNTYALKFCLDVHYDEQLNFALMVWDRLLLLIFPRLILKTKMMIQTLWLLL